MADTTSITILSADRATTVVANLADLCTSGIEAGVLLAQEKLTLAFAHETSDVQLIAPGMIVQLDSRDMEYRVRDRTTSDKGAPSIETFALWHDLQDHTLRKSYDSGRVKSVFSIVKRTPALALAEIMESAPSGFEAGTIDAALVAVTPEVTLSFKGENVLAGIAKLAQALNGEWKIRVVNSSGARTYYVDIVPQVGTAGNRLITDTHSGVSNQLGLTRKRHASEYFSRLGAIVGDETENATLADAEWEVASQQSVSIGNGFGQELTLTGSPVPFDDCFIDYFFGTKADGFFRIVDSVAPNKITIRTSYDSIVKGQFASTSAGRILDFIPILKALEDTFGIVEKTEPFEGTPIVNLLRENGISDDMNDFTAGLPTGWNQVGTPLVEQITDEVATATGSASALIQADEGEGIETDLVDVPGQYLYAWIAVQLEAGELAMQVVDEEGNILPEQEVPATNTKVLRALEAGVIEGFVGQCKLRITALRDETVIKLDAVTLTPSGNSYPWAPIMGARDLWEQAGIVVDEKGGAVYDEVSAEAIDLAEAGVEGYDRIELGSLITIQTSENPSSGDFDLDIDTRVVEMQREIISDDVFCNVKLERHRADLSDLLTRIRNERRRDIPDAPRTAREKPTLKVTRASDVDSETFTLEPLDGKARPLKNWEIYADVGAGTFSLVATDKDELKVDGVDMYPAGSGYAGALPGSAVVTVDVTFPPSTEKQKLVRFYVIHKTSGLASDILEYVVQNPYVNASRVEGQMEADQLVADAQKFNSDVDFSSPDWDTVSWDVGNVSLSDGTTYPIAAGSTGDMAASSKYWIYFDAATADAGTPNALIATTTYDDAVGDGKIILCFARAALQTDQFAMRIPVFGVAGLNEENVQANTIQTNHLQANVITSVKIDALAVRAEHIEAGAVTLTTLDFTPLISAGTTGAIVATINASVEGIRITSDNLIIDGSAQYADGFDPSDGRTLQESATAPTTRPSGDPLKVGDLWVDTSTGDEITKFYNGAGWTENITRLSGAYIKTGLIAANHIQLSVATTYAAGYDPTDKFDLSGNTLDDAADGITYARVLSTAISAGRILLSQATGDFGDIDGNLDDIPDGAFYEKVNASAVSAGNLLLGQAAGDLDDIDDGGSYEKVLGTSISAGKIILTEVQGDLDDIADGTYAKVLATKISAGSILLAETLGSLDDIPDGTYGKILSTKISAGSILLSEATGNLGDIADGGTYAKVKSTQVSAGLIVIKDALGATIISGGVLQSNVITANHLSVSTLSAVAANTGSLSVTGSLELTAAGVIDLGTGGGNLVAGNGVTLSDNGLGIDTAFASLTVDGNDVLHAGDLAGITEWHQGNYSGAPGSGVGKQGDLAHDAINDGVYFKKTSSAWVQLA